MTYEELLIEADAEGIHVDENFSFSSNLKGLYIDKNIALADSLKTTAEKACILSEELGHYYTSTGNILDQSVSENRKQEYRARLMAYDKLVGLKGIIDAYNKKCHNCYEMAEYLNVTESFLTEVLETYKSKYGPYTTAGNYVIYFEPSLAILKLYK